MENQIEWQNWKWQQQNRIHDLSELNEHYSNKNNFNDYYSKHFTQWKALLDEYSFSATPYYLGLIQSFTRNDPIFNQIIPTLPELSIQDYELDDPISDEKPKIGFATPKGLTHRYPDRVLFYPTPICSVHCRYCFRKRLVGKSSFILSKEEINNTVQYVTLNKTIKEVIFTGGDPLSLSNNKLKTLLKRFSVIPHIKTIRIHTRYPVTNPFRLTHELLTLFKSISTPIWLVTHFNSHIELTDEAIHHLSRFIQNGIPILNQSVLLKDVNDTEEKLTQLLRKLIENRVQPYYLHQADLVKGTSHLRVPKERGIELIKNIRGQIPGYAIPTYIWDRPGGIGKIPLCPSWDKE